MKDVIVVSYATHRAGLLDEYEAQLAVAGIDFHLEPVELQAGINSVTARWKFEFMRRMCERFKEYDRIVFTDAWDVLFFGTKDELIWKMDTLWTVVISAERNCWPEPEPWQSANWCYSPWRFMNAGSWAGKTHHFASVLDELLALHSIDIGEQALLNQLLCQMGNPGPARPDRETFLFYTVSSDKEDRSLRMERGRPYNGYHDVFPQFFHFSGKCPTEPFRRMLETGEPLCASV